jgi:hypothetical protein
MFYGFMSQLGEPARNTTQAQINSMHNFSVVVLATGCISLFFSLWLSGYSFSDAKLRASLALAGCVLPIIIVAVRIFA